MLDVLLSNSFAVCTLVVIYGVILILAQRNLEKLAEKAKTLENGNILYSNDPAAALAEKGLPFWEELRKTSRFPFIALASSFLVYRVTQENMNKLLVRFISQKQKMQRRGKR